MIPSSNLNLVTKSAPISPDFIKIYISHTTIPPLLFYADAAKNPHALKIFHTQRFNNISALNMDNIKKYNKISSMLKTIKKTLQKYPSKKVELHTQIHGLEMYSKVFKAIPTDRIAHVHIYDDGSEDYVHFYQDKRDSIQEIMLNASDKAWQHFFSGESDSIGSRYTIAKYFPVTHWMLRPDYLDRSDMQIIKKAMTQNNAQIKKIDFNHIRAQLSESEKKKYFRYIGFNYRKNKKLLNKPSNLSFVLTGSTVYDDPNKIQEFSKGQINMIRNVINPTGILYKHLDRKNYHFILKLHPSGRNTNNKIKSIVPNYPCIPESVGYEALIVSGLSPDKTGGFLSSLYFNIPKEKISFLVAVTDRESVPHDPLIQVMIELGIIEQSAVYCLSDLKHLN